MRCPFCTFGESKVVDTRPNDENNSIRRRRECLSCKKRFTSYEVIERIPLLVIKKDGTRQTFDRNKLLNSILRACDKRTISLQDQENIVTEIETSIHNDMKREISAEQLGKMVMMRLKDRDQVAYVRFASVYRQFTDLSDFADELKRLRSE